MDPKPFNVKLTTDERDRLEAHRIRLGLRSHADVVRRWIAQDVFPKTPIEERQHKMTEALAPNRSGAWATSHPVTTDMSDAENRERLKVQVGPTKRKAGHLLKKPKG